MRFVLNLWFNFALLSMVIPATVFSQEESPISIILMAHTRAPKSSVDLCSYHFVPIVTSQSRLRENILSSDLYRFGVLTTEAGFTDSKYLNYLSKDYLACLRTCNLERYKTITYGGQTWLLSIHPSKEMREIAVYHNNVAKTYDLKDLPSLEAYLNTQSTNLDFNPSTNLLSEFRSKLQDSEHVSGYMTNLAQVTAVAATYSLLKAPAIVRGINRILEWMDPKKIRLAESLSSVSLEDVLSKVILDKVYWQGAVGASRRILQRMKSGGTEGKFFDDIYDSFVELGLGHEEAYARSWDLIGLYSTRGASIGQTLMHISPDLKPLAVSMSTIGTGMNVLDALYFSIGKNYSFPENLQVSFDNGKPYHFWMSAYLARRLALEGIDGEAAGIAAFISQLGYQMKSQTLGRDPVRAFTAEAFSPANNKIRLDLVYAGAGVRFGAESTTEFTARTYNLDEGLKTMFKGSEPLEPLPKKEAERQWQGFGADGYFRWKKIFNPDVLLKFFR